LQNACRLRPFAELVRLQNLLAEIANTVALDHADAIGDVRDLRDAVPGCLGYAVAHEDPRMRELVGSIQRRAGAALQLPTDTAMSSAVLDAMEAANPPPDERDFFKFLAGAALFSGIGAAAEGSARRGVRSD
jgi:hypothetical protein